MDNALNSIALFLEKIFGPEGAALLVDDLKIALASDHKIQCKNDHEHDSADLRQTGNSQ